MTVLIDRPIWPAHNTVWAHIVSDTSLEELHDFAQRAGIPRRGFDLDHYDVPAHKWHELVARDHIAADLSLTERMGERRREPHRETLRFANHRDNRIRVDLRQ